MGSGGTRVQNGRLIGTGAEISVRTVGFRPRMVELYNVTSGDKMVWTQTMADAAGVKTVAAGATSYVTSAGVTPLSDGFKLGADTDMNVSGESVHYVAHE